jgi:hypothetical protein
MVAQLPNKGNGSSDGDDHLDGRKLSHVVGPAVAIRILKILDNLSRGCRAS